MRRIAVLPNLITRGNAFCGLLAVAKADQRQVTSRIKGHGAITGRSVSDRYSTISRYRMQPWR